MHLREAPLTPKSTRPASAKRARKDTPAGNAAGRSVTSPRARSARASGTVAAADDTTKPRLTQRARAERSERLLMEAAVELMAQQGFERTTVAQIAARAGYSPGLVNHRFGSKLELLDRLIEHGQQEFYTEVLGPALGGKRGLAALLEAMDVRLRTNRNSARTLAFYTVMGECLGPVPQIRPAYVRAGQAIRDSFRKFILEGQEDGDIRQDISVDAATGILTALARGVVFQWLIEGDAFDLERIRQENRAWLTRALRPDPPGLPGRGAGPARPAPTQPSPPPRAGGRQARTRSSR